MPAKSPPDFPAVFAALRALMEPYSGRGLQITADNAENFLLGGPETPVSLGREVWFGGVQIKKNYVSFHLMPVYAYPDLLEKLSPELKKRMQGKSCFNFTRLDEGLVAELAELTARGYQRYTETGMIAAQDS